jgi:hypothetical protein
MSLMHPYPLTPRVLRGRPRRLAWFREDTGEAVVVPARYVTGVEGLTSQPQTVASGAGHAVRRGKAARLACVVTEQGAAEPLRRWAADGVPCVAVWLASPTLGGHVVWAEPVPIHTEPAYAGAGALVGTRVWLESTAFDAEAEQSDDLLAVDRWRDSAGGPGTGGAGTGPDGVPDGWTNVGASPAPATMSGGLLRIAGNGYIVRRDVPMPFPGVTVRAEAEFSPEPLSPVVRTATVTVQALSASGAELAGAQATDSVFNAPLVLAPQLALPDGTRWVRVILAANTGAAQLAVPKPRLTLVP